MNSLWNSSVVLRVVLFALLQAFATAALWGADANAVDTSAGAPPGASAPTVDPAKSPPESENGYLKLGFDRLASFSFIPPAFDGAADGKPIVQTGEEQIPPVVKSWNGKKAVI